MNGKLEIKRNREDFYRLQINDTDDYIEFDLADIGLPERILNASDNIFKIDEDYQKQLKEIEENCTEEVDKLRRKTKLDKEVLEFKVKTGENDRVFGSISQKQIKDSLQEKGYKLEKSQIDNSNQISSLGFHNVNINIYGNIKATVKVHLVK